MENKLTTTALVFRKIEGKIQIFGSSLSDFDMIEEGTDYLILGEVTIKPLHVFKDYKKDAGNTPDNLMKNGGLNHNNYKTKLF